MISVSYYHYLCLIKFAHFSDKVHFYDYSALDFNVVATCTMCMPADEMNILIANI